MSGRVARLKFHIRPHQSFPLAGARAPVKNARDAGGFSKGPLCAHSGENYATDAAHIARRRTFKVARVLRKTAPVFRAVKRRRTVYFLNLVGRENLKCFCVTSASLQRRVVEFRVFHKLGAVFKWPAIRTSVFLLI